jgi:hypothetical protein
MATSCERGSERAERGRPSEWAERDASPSVVVATGEDSDLVTVNVVKQTMFLVDALRPAASELMLEPEPLGFANAAERIALGLLDQAKRMMRRAFLRFCLLNPPGQIFECGGIKFQALNGLPQGQCRRVGPG